MAKLVPFHQIIEVEEIFRDVKIGGLVTKSNFLVEDERHLFTIDDEAAEKINKGDRIKITFFSNKDDVEKEDDKLRFRARGVKYELWNKENEGWDRIFEKMMPQT